MSSQTTTHSNTHVRLPHAHLPSTVLPGAVLTLSLNTDELRRAVEAATTGTDAPGRLILTGGDEHTLGVVARVPNIGNLPNGDPAAIVQIEGRARIVALDAPDSDDAVTLSGRATFAEVEVLTDAPSTSSIDAATRELRATLDLIAELRRSRRLPEILRTTSTPGELADAVATWAEFSDADRLVVLRAVNLSDRVDAIHSWARNHLAELQVAQSIRDDVSEGVDKQQREWLLRQQLNSIRKELGEGDDDVVGDFRTKLESARRTRRRQVGRRQGARPFRTDERPVARARVGAHLARPDLRAAVGSAQRRHVGSRRGAASCSTPITTGLTDVKDRIVEFLATRKLRHDRGIDDRANDTGGRRARGEGAIITLVGPPGVGKTSLGESIARAMGREFVRVALGGVRDEAEIRGHRRTYVGSQPGRLVRALQEAGTMNPVILLDEVDKLAAGGWSGDPTAALLEVLDPAQNHTFRDHYLEVDLDLSEVVFIATANVADTIPAPLLDRMDLVRLDGYTDDEKVFIANRYLLPAPDRARRAVARRGRRRRRGDHRGHPRLHPGGRRPLART